MSQHARRGFFQWLDGMDRRVIYALVMLALLVPVLANVALEPAPMESAQKFYDTIAALRPRDDRIVFLAMDWDPATKAENGPQTEAAIEQLMRKRVKFALISMLPTSEPFLLNLPKKVARHLEAESRRRHRPQTWSYGKDWVNLGFRPNLRLVLQQIPKAADLRDVFKTDAEGELLKNIPCMRDISRFDQVPLLAEFTGSVGAFDLWVQFFQSKNHRPLIVHGCTSITIPEAYIYLDSGQLAGLLEGVAGAAYYSKLLGYSTDKPNTAMKNMTALAVAHFLIILFVLLGNVGMVARSRARRAGGGSA